MAVVHAQTPALVAAKALAAAALRILKRLLHGFVGGDDLRLWNDSSFSLGVGPPAFTLVLRDPMLLPSLVTTSAPVLLADAHFGGQIDFEGDLDSAPALKGHFEGLVLPWRDQLAMPLDAERVHACAYFETAWNARASRSRMSKRCAAMTHRPCALT